MQLLFLQLLHDFFRLYNFLVYNLFLYKYPFFQIFGSHQYLSYFHLLPNKLYYLQLLLHILYLYLLLLCSLLFHSYYCILSKYYLTLIHNLRKHMPLSYTNKDPYPNHLSNLYPCSFLLDFLILIKFDHFLFQVLSKLYLCQLYMFGLPIHFHL